MSTITYQTIDDALVKQIVDKYGEWVLKYNCLPRGDNCYGVAALADGDVIGFAAFGPGKWIYPLDMYTDAYIQDIEVDEAFRRRGIGRRMIGMLEEQARTFGYRQIRAWSSVDKFAALHMWVALNYAMCPAVDVYWAEHRGEIVHGYYYAKLLSPAQEQCLF